MIVDNDERMMSIPKSDIDMLVLKANIELLQRVNHWIICYLIFAAGYCWGSFVTYKIMKLK